MTRSARQRRVSVVTHGGAGSTRDALDGCEAAGRRALQRLGTSGSSLDAVVAAVVSLEDDSRFNAGTGAHLGLDGKTVELDAAVMDARGKLGRLPVWALFAILSGLPAPWPRPAAGTFR